MADLNKNEVVEMAQACIREIEQLRASNATLAPKADAYDTVRTILDLLPQRPQSYGEDLVWKLKRRIEELQAPAVKDEDNGN